jgi:hypothetical protein
VCQPNAIPGNRRGWLLGLELEDLKDPATGDAHPADLETHGVLDGKERSHTLGWVVRNADQATAEDVRVELHEAVEVRDGDPDVAE